MLLLYLYHLNLTSDKADFLCCCADLVEDLTDIPVVSLVIEGGPNTLQTAAEAMDAGTAVVVFAGSGRAADFIVAACDSKLVNI
jgi:hypothetical protein